MRSGSGGEPASGKEPERGGGPRAVSRVGDALAFVARGFARGVAVSLLLAAHFAIWFFGWLLLVVTFRARARRRAWFGERLTALLIGLGATFVKLGQIMSTRPDLFPPHIIRALSRLQDDVGAFAYRHIERAFVREFGKPPDELFASFERAPVASASVAQVHRAALAGGRCVAVKVRRPGLEHVVAFDLAVMKLVARAMCVWPTARLFAPVESVEEFARAIRAQIDLSIEADNNRRFRENFAADPDIVFPELVEELCSPRILTMTFVDGVKIMAYGQVGADPTRLAKIGFRVLLQMVFEHGFVHADLHPGNILVVPGESSPGAGGAGGAGGDDDGGGGGEVPASARKPRVAILDLGLTAELDDTHRVAFAKYFAGWAQGDGVVMAKLMYDLSPGARVADYAAYEADVCAFVNRYLGKALGEVQVSTVVFDMMNIMRTHRVRVNPTFTMCNIAIAVTEGIGKQLDPELDLMREALPFFAELQRSGALRMS